VPGSSSRWQVVRWSGRQRADDYWMHPCFPTLHALAVRRDRVSSSPVCRAGRLAAT